MRLLAFEKISDLCIYIHDIPPGAITIKTVIFNKSGATPESHSNHTNPNECSITLIY